MSQYDDTNKGAIWKNDDRASDKHPHFKGNANINGVDYWVSAWKRDPEGNPKAPALRFSFQPKEGKPATGKDSERFQAPKPSADFDDEIPF